MAAGTDGVTLDAAGASVGAVVGFAAAELVTASVGSLIVVKK